MQSLSDRISSVINSAPNVVDPEDDIYEETTARVSQNEQTDVPHESEVALSNFRKLNIDFLENVDTKYTGKKGSRSALYCDDESLDGEHVSEHSEDESMHSESTTEDSEFEAQDEIDDQEVTQEDDIKQIHLDTTSQVKKGNCVHNQLNIWESLLEMRIQFQKCLFASNRMPQYDSFSTFNTYPEFQSQLSKTKKSLKNLLDKFLTLNELLLNQYPETKKLMKKDNSDIDISEEICSDTDGEVESENEEINIPKKRRKLQDYDKTIESNFENYKNYRNSVIQKWNDKTRLAVGKNNGALNSVLQQINYILSDKSKLVKRTRLKRTDYDIVGKEKNDEDNNKNEGRQCAEYDSEIYDDEDFYHQLLRELIEHKSTGITDPVQMTRNWIALQKYRNKIKKPIDTKATKGRKIRYDVHTKLVNFMAPINQYAWTEDAKVELYNSLFGN